MDWEEEKEEHSIPRDVLRELSKGMITSTKAFIEYVENNKAEFKIGNKSYEKFKESHETLERFLKPLSIKKLSKYKDVFRNFSDSYHFMLNEIGKHKMPQKWDLQIFLDKILEEKSKLSGDLIADPRLENMKKITKLRQVVKDVQEKHGRPSLN